jgi:hypothetical protein
MYVTFAVYGANCGAEQDAVAERAEQTARFVQIVREWRRKRKAVREQRRERRRKRTAYTTAA